tara:strand:- start:1694 stop:2827 length:1134 start_codon:yes stop_codon:yes gene_type:complete
MAEKIPANRGDLFEVFFAAAVAARFVKRSKTKSGSKLPSVTSSDVDSILTEMMKRGYTKNVNDVGSAVIDTVSVSVSVPKKAQDFLANKANWNKVADLKNGAISFVNYHNRINAQARGLSINERQDIIRVTAAGTEDQKGTKADVKIEINSPTNPDRRFRNIDYSLKVEGGEQFHQVSGQGFDKFLSIFGEMGLDVSPIANQYQKFIDEFFDKEVFTKKYASRDVAKETGGGEYLKKAARLVYTYATKKLNEGLDTGERTNTKVKFADYIIYGLSRDVNTELVKFAGGGKVKTRVANREFRDLLASSRFNAIINTSGDPKIEIYLSEPDGTKMKGKNNLIIQIRYKMEVASGASGGMKMYRFYPRNYLEAQPGMFLI